MARPTVDIQGIVQVGTLDADVVNAQKQTFGGGFGVDAAGNLTANSVTVGPNTPTALVGGQDLSAALRLGGGPWNDVSHPSFAGGADMTGVATGGASVLAATNAAASLAAGYKSRGSVFVPPGVVKLTTTASMTPTNAATVTAGIHFFGVGMYTSILRLSTSGSDLYFYDNGATAREQHCTFSDLGFEGMDRAAFTAYTDISVNAKGFRLWSAGHEQGFNWTRCRLSCLASMYETAGTNTASENGFALCFFEECRTQFALLNNIASNDHEFHKCDWTDMYGNGFVIGANGAGSVKVFGGSCIMQSSSGADTYFWTQTTGVGFSGGRTVFNGLQMELLGNFTNLVSMGSVAYGWLVFEECGIHTTSTTTKAAWVSVLQNGQVHFVHCTFLEGTASSMQFICAGTATQYGLNGEIYFDTCIVPVDWSDRCSVTNVGHIHGLNLIGANLGGVTAGAHWAHDFSLHGNQTVGQLAAWTGVYTSLTDSGSPTHPQWVLKTAQIKLDSDVWPGSSGWPEQTLKLPKNAILKNIYLRKPGGGADATAVVFYVNRNDKSGTPHVTSNSAAYDATHTGDHVGAPAPYFYYVGATTNERTLRLYASAVTTGFLQNGLLLVEYY